MISRQWRGLAKPDQAQNYVEHLRTSTFPALQSLPGFVSASILSRRLGDGIEYLVVTQWRTLDDIARFCDDRRWRIRRGSVVGSRVDADANGYRQCGEAAAGGTPFACTGHSYSITFIRGAVGQG